MEDSIAIEWKLLRAEQAAAHHEYLWVHERLLERIDGLAGEPELLGEDLEAQISASGKLAAATMAMHEFCRQHGAPRPA